jgi:hypothetical protein
MTANRTPARETTTSWQPGTALHGTPGDWLLAAADADRAASWKWGASFDEPPRQSLTYPGVNMIKRISAAAIGIALALSATSAQARPYFGYDGRHYGELENAPAFLRPKIAERGTLDASDAPRKCLTSAVRAVLEKVEDNFGPVRVISTCRPGATIAGSGRVSRHASGNAVDFEAGDRKGKIIEWLVANHPSGGTMTYADMSHIHIDVGQHFVSLAGGRKYASSRRGRSSGRYAQVRSNDRGYSRSYDGGSSRRYAREVSYEARGSSYYGGSQGREQYSGGYATMYH